MAKRKGIRFKPKTKKPSAATPVDSTILQPAQLETAAFEPGAVDQPIVEQVQAESAFEPVVADAEPEPFEPASIDFGVGQASADSEPVFEPVAADSEPAFEPVVADAEPEQFEPAAIDFEAGQESAEIEQRTVYGTESAVTMTPPIEDQPQGEQAETSDHHDITDDHVPTVELVVPSVEMERVTTIDIEEVKAEVSKPPKTRTQTASRRTQAPTARTEAPKGRRKKTSKTAVEEGEEDSQWKTTASSVETVPFAWRHPLKIEDRSVRVSKVFRTLEKEAIEREMLLPTISLED